MVKYLRKALAALALLLIPHQAFAFDWDTVSTVSRIETTYTPTLIQFMIVAPVNGCPAGNFLQWYARGADQPSQIANIQATLTALLTAESFGRQIQIGGNGCTVEYLHVL